MWPDIIGAGLGLLGQIGSNNRAQDAMDAQMQQQAAIQKLFTDNYNQIHDYVNRTMQSGALDPQHQINMFRSNLDKANIQAQDNMAGGLRTLGYQPGDSAPLRALQNIGANYATQQSQGIQSIRDNALAKQAQYMMMPGEALQGLGQMGSQSLQAAGMYGNQIQPLQGSLLGLMGAIQRGSNAGIFKTSGSQTIGTLGGSGSTDNGGLQAPIFH